MLRYPKVKEWSCFVGPAIYGRLYNSICEAIIGGRNNVEVSISTKNVTLNGMPSEIMTDE